MTEKVWGELKKIEAQAETIRVEAQNTATKLAEFSRQQAEKLIANSKIYAEEDANQLYSREVDAAQKERDESLKEHKKSVEKLKAKARERVGLAASAIEMSVLGEGNR